MGRSHSSFLDDGFGSGFHVPHSLTMDWEGDSLFLKTSVMDWEGGFLSLIPP